MVFNCICKRLRRITFYSQKEKAHSRNLLQQNFNQDLYSSTARKACGC